MAGAELERGAQLAGRISGDSTVAYALAFARAVEAALGVEAPPRAHLAARADGRARAPRQSFRRHRRDLQRRRLRADACPLRHAARAGAARRRRLLRPSPDDGPHRAGRRRARSRAATASARSARCSPRSARRFPAAGRALRQHRLAAGPHRRHRRCSTPTLARAIRRRRLCRPRLRAALSMRAGRIAYPPYDELDFDVPVLEEGDVNARVWIRIREVEQSLALIEQILARLPRRADRAPSCRIAGEVREGHGAGRGLPRRHPRLAAPRRGRPRSSAAICAIRPGSSGRCSKRRSRATSSPTSRSATNPSTAPIRATISRGTPCASLLFKSLFAPPLTEPAPARRRRRRSPSSPRALDRAARRRLGRSLSIREVDAGSCNGCELEIHALNNAFYDLERFGLRFVASPRHADVLLVTGPVTKNMREALERTYDATPDPKWVVAVGDCAVDGGMFAGSYAVVGGVAEVVPVDLHIRGCPPTPDRAAQGPARAARTRPSDSAGEMMVPRGGFEPPTRGFSAGSQH